MVIGVGTELKRLLKHAGISSTPTCDCDAHALIMNEEGPDWCLQNMDIIVEWMRREAQERRMLFSEIAAKMLVRLAVRNTRKKLSILQDDPIHRLANTFEFTPLEVL